MMAILSKLLFVIGATATGFMAAALLALLALPMIFPTGRDSWGAAPFFVVALLLCGLLGGFASLLSSVHRVAQNSMPAWSLGTWVGAGVGVAVGLLLRLTVIAGDNLVAYFVGWLPGLFVLLSAAGFIGGVCGHCAWSEKRGRGANHF